MPDVSIRPDFPNILIISGIDVYQSETMEGLTRHTLDQGVSDKVRPGTHEFWIMHPIPNLGGSSQFNPAADSGMPHRRRGTVEMRKALPNDAASMGDYLSAFLQEVGHHWLVPKDMKVGGASMLTLAAVTHAVTNDLPFKRAPLLARDNSHWSAYWKTDYSPMDGVCFQTIGAEDGYSIWGTTSACEQEIDLVVENPDGGVQPLPGDAVGVAPRVKGFNDLDLYIMGVKSAKEAYNGDKRITWMRPRITHGVESHAGLTVIFSQTDQLMFGFDGSDRKLTIRNAANEILQSVDVAPTYHPLLSNRSGLLFRVIRRGVDYSFQARIAKAGGFLDWLTSLFGAPLKYAWDELFPPNQVDLRNDFRRWRTVSTISHPGEPQAIGLFVNRWTRAHLCDAGFFRFEINSGGAVQSLTTRAVPQTITRGDYAHLSTSSLRYEEAPGALLRTRWGRLHIVTPVGLVSGGTVTWHGDKTFQYMGVANDGFLDNAPRVLCAPPKGDFAFVTHARLHRTVLAAQAGGSARDKAVFGKTWSVSAAAIGLSRESIAKQKHPPANVCRMAFIAVVADAATLTTEDLQKLENARLYAEACFHKVTSGRLRADTTL